MRKTIILAYHDIDSTGSPSEKIDAPTLATVVRAEEFDIHMSYLSAKGYSVISVSQYLDKKRNNKLSDRDIVLTFDDGHMSNHRFALPILQKYSFYATFFIIADYVGKPCYMKIDEINALLDAGMEIGSHGKSHSYLTELRQDEVDNEVRESKRLIESILGKEINVFCYPGGHQNRQIVKSVKSAGYQAAVSCILGRNSHKTNPFLLRRIELRRGTSLEDFQSAINPRKITFFQCIDLGKHLLKKTLGLRAYNVLRQKLFPLYPFKR